MIAGVHFEPVITLGNLLAIMCMCVPVMFTYVYAVRRMTALEAKVDMLLRILTHDASR
jgi:hypothetical protein